MNPISTKIASDATDLIGCWAYVKLEIDGDSTLPQWRKVLDVHYATDCYDHSVRDYVQFLCEDGMSNKWNTGGDNPANANVVNYKTAAPDIEQPALQLAFF